MAQKNIDFGTFPDDPNADAIRTAFQKVQENFTDLYAGLQQQAVLSVNKTPGAGITVYPTTGNVIVSANIACVQVYTSTLSIGRDSNGSQYASITQSSQKLWVDLPETISNVANANLTNTLTANYVNANITVNTANLIATGTANVTGNLNAGNANLGNLTTSNYYAGVLTTAAQPNITSVGTLTSLAVSGNVTSGNVYSNSGIVQAQYLKGDGSNITGVVAVTGPIIANGTSNVNIPASGGNVNTSVGGVANVLVATASGVNVAGTGNFTGNLSAANLIGPHASGNSNISITANANINLYVAGNATARMVATSTGVNVAGTLNATGNANVGNIGATAGVFTTVAGSLTTAAQPNITSVGTLSSLGVTGNVTAGNLIGPHANGNSNVNIPAANGNVNISAAGNANVLIVTGTGINVAGTLTTTGIITGNGNGLSSIQAANIVGTVATASTAGTVTTNAQPNITSVGTLTSLGVNGTITAVNITANTGVFTGNGNGLSSIQGANVTGAVAYASTANAVAGANVSGAVSYATTANAVAGANVSGQVSYAAVANSVAGANVSGTVANATYATSAGSATTAGSATSADNATTAGTVTTNAQPNITSVGTLTSLTVSGNVTAGNVSGANLISANYFTGTLTTAAQPNITSVGTLSSLGVTANVTAGNFVGRLANGNSNVNIPAANGNVNISAAGNANIVVVTGSGVNVAGTLNTGSGIISGNGSGLISLTGANVTGAVSYATTANSVAGANVTGAVSYATTANAVAGANVSGTVANATYATSAGSATTAGTVTTNAQPNITSLGTLTSLGVNGTITAVNITANTGVFTGNGNGLSSIQGANVTGTVANATYAVSAGSATTAGSATSAGSATTAGTVTTNAQPNITSVGTLTSLAVSGNVTAGNVTGANLISANYFTGTLTTAAQPNITSVGTLSALTVSGNLSAGNIDGGNLVKANFFQGDGGLLSNISISAGTTILNGNSNVAVDLNGNVRTSVAGTSNVFVVTSAGTLTTGTANVNGELVSSNANLGNLAKANYFQGIITTNAQPNITSLGTLTSLNANGPANLGYISNVMITGGSNNQVLVATGVNGNLAFVTATALTFAPGANTQLLFNDAGSFAANANLTFNKTNGNLTVGGNLNVTKDVVLTTSNISGVNVLSATTLTGTLSAGPQTGINAIGTLSALSVSGTAAANNISISNYANAKYVYSNSGTITANIHSVAAIQIWNNASTQFSAIEANITDTASAANSLLIDLQISNVSKFAVSKEGNVFFSGAIAGNGSGLTALPAANVTGTLANSVTNSISNVGTITSGTWNSSFVAGLSGANLASLNASNISSGTLAQARLANSSLTVNGTSVSLGGSATITANTTQALTLGSYLTGTSFNGGTAVTATVDATTTSTASKVVARDANANIYANNAVFNNVSGNGSALSSITGANVTGTVANATYATSAGTAGTVTTNAQPNINSTGTLTGVTIAANGNIAMSGSLSQITGANLVSASYISGNGSALSSITGANVTGTVANATYAVSAGSATNSAAVLSNVRSTGTYYPAFIAATANGNYSLNANSAFSANLNSGTFYANVFTGNLIKSDNTNFVTNISASYVDGGYFGPTAATSYSVIFERFRGNINTYTEVASGDQLGEIDFKGWDGFTANTAASITSIVDASYTAGSGSAPGAIAFNTANASQGGVPTEKMRIASTGNVGIANTNPTHTLSITGTLNVSSNANVGNLGAARIISSVATGTAPFVVTSTTQVANLNVANAGYASSAATAGTVTTAAQPNITSVGTLTSVVTSGNIYANSGVVVAGTTDATNGPEILRNYYAGGGATTVVGSEQSSGGVVLGYSVKPNTTSSGTFLSSVTGAFARGAYTISDSHRWYTGASQTVAIGGAVTTSEKMRLDNSGNLGIGTSTAYKKLTIGDDANGSANIGVAFSTAATERGSITMAGGTGILSLTAGYAGYGGVLVVNTNGAERMRVDTNGNVGIGNTAPAHTLSITGTAAVSGNITAQSNVNMSGYVIRSVAAGVSAAGTVQGNATVIAKEMNLVSTVATGSGVILPTAVAGMAITIINTSANALLVYPHVGGDINGGTANAAFSQPSGATLQFVAPNTTDWYTVGATFA